MTKDIEREAFEKALAGNGIHNIKVCTIFDDEKNEYFASDVCDPSEDHIVESINLSWRMWQAAKAQAVLEKDAIIQKLSDQLYAQEMKTSGARVLCETACELLDGYAHQDAMVILNDLEQAMKEPAND